MIMNTSGMTLRALLFAMCIFLVFGCSTLNDAKKSSAAADNVPMYEEGKGRADMTLAILRPEGKGLSPDEEKYLDIIQGALNSTFNRFSAIKLFDSKNLEVILEQQQLSLSGNYSDSDYIRIGELSNSKYILKGELSKTENAMFRLYLSITEVETGVIKGTFDRPITLREIINSNACRAAAAELLPRLGVELTAAGITALNSEQSAEETEAQNALALSYEASRSGNLIDALIYSYTASSADKNSKAAKEQAESTFKMMGGTGTRIKQDIERQAFWKKNLIAFENFYRNHPPFELVYTSVPVQSGLADYEKSTVDFEFTVGLRHNSVNTMQKVLRDILKELRQTDYKKNKWGFDNWPAISAESTRDNQKKTDFLNEYLTFNVKAALFNDADEITSVINFPLYGQLLLKPMNTIGATATQERHIALTVNTDLVTEGMQIRIISINGIDVDKANVDGYMRNSIVEKMPSKSLATIPKDQRLLPELPEERAKRLAIEEKQTARQIAWDSKPLQTRRNISASVLYNPLPSDWEDALALEAGLGYGYKNFSIHGRFTLPMGPLVDQSNGNGAVYGIGAATGYSFVWKYMLLGLEGGAVYYWDSNAGAFLPTLEGKFDVVPWQTGLALRLGYRLEFGSPDSGDFYASYFGKNNSFGGGSFRVVGYPSAGIVIWY